MPEQQWFEWGKEYLESIEAEMRDCLPMAGFPPLQPFYGMMAYHLGWLDAEFRPANERTGKRLRPLLCLLACEAVSGSWRPALPAAAAVELLHNFTLIHDDIEDGSPLRRGRPTVWSLWGGAQAINTGDGLFVLARAALLRLRQQALPEGVVLRAVEVLDQTILHICEGQYLDLVFEGNLDVDERAYIEMIARKTAALLDAAVHMGALIGGGNAAAVRSLRAFGHALGMAFQIQDDLLGVWGEEDHTGKPASADIHGRKLGLPVVHAWAHAAEGDRALLEQVYAGKGVLSGTDVSSVLTVLARSNSRKYVEQKAAHYHDQALEMLHALSPSPARDAMREMARSLLGRRG